MKKYNVKVFRVDFVPDRGTVSDPTEYAVGYVDDESGRTMWCAESHYASLSSQRVWQVQGDFPQGEKRAIARAINIFEKK